MFKIPASYNERIHQKFSNHNLETQIKAQLLFKLYMLGILLICVIAITYIAISPKRVVLVLGEVSPIMLVLIISTLFLSFGRYNLSIIIVVGLSLLSNSIRNFFPDFLGLSVLSLTDNTARLMLLILFIILFSSNYRCIFFTFAASFCLLLFYSNIQYQVFWHSELRTCLVLLLGSFLIGFLTRVTHSIILHNLDASQNQLKAAKIRAEASLQAKSDFLSNMSHEIRTPMNSIIGFINLVMTDKKVSKLHLDYLTTAKSSANNLLGLLDKIIDISKLDSRMLTFENYPFSLSSLIKEIESTLEAKACKKGLHLSCEIQPSLSDSLIGDPLRLRQLLISLIDNAIKFTENGSILIRIMSAQKENQIHFSISDTGIGIRQDQQSKIFDPFTQLDASTTRRFGGIGVGLTTARYIVEKMGGTLCVKSEENKGSVFHFTINLPPTSRPPENKDFHPPIPHQPAFSPRRKGFKILIVEDNKMNATLSEIRLKEQGHQVKIVHNGQKAVKAALSEELDVILMDIHMPIMNGLEATEQIRKQKPDLPIIAVTADDKKNVTDRYLEIGIDAVVGKPVNFNTLFEILDNLVPENIGEVIPKQDTKIFSKTFGAPTGLKTLHHASKPGVKEMDMPHLKIIFKEMLLAFDQFNPYVLKPFVAELKQYVSQNQLDSLIEHLKRFDLQGAEKETVKLMKKLKINHGG